MLFILTAFAVLFSRFLHPAVMLGFYQDDFFYYLKVVQNLAVHGISSFDGIHLTNGYHPLWLLTLLALYKLVPAPAFFYVLQTLTVACALLFYWRTERLLGRFCDDALLRSLATLLVSLLALLLFRYGMEITLTLPLAVWLVDLFLLVDEKQAAISAVHLGLVAALLTLSRLDAILLVVLLLAAIWLPRRDRRSTVWAAYFLLGCVPPLLLYFALNHHVFQTFMPVSGQAKQMKAGLWPSLQGPRSLVWPLDRMKLIFLPMCLVLWLVGVACVRRASRSLSRPLPRQQILVFCALLTFPFLHLFTLSVLSDWALWPWYLYPFVLSAVAACALATYRLQQRSQIDTTQPRGRTLPLSVATIFCGLNIVYLAAYCVLMPNSVTIYVSSAQLAAYMDAHPGLYAMGDQAGTTAYLSTQPIIQLEGLTMDAAYLRRIRRREPLREALADYGVRYYVTFPGRSINDCIAVREPAQAGPASPVLEGKVCGPPLATFYRASQKIAVYPVQSVQ